MMTKNRFFLGLATVIVALCFALPAFSKEYFVVVQGEFDRAHNFKHLVDVAQNATTEDTINIFLHSGGGYVHIAHYLSQELKLTEAQVKVTMEEGAKAYSAAALFLIMLPYGTTYNIHNDARIMFHSITFPTYKNERYSGKHKDGFVTEGYLRTYVYGHRARHQVLTKHEFYRILGGNDVYLSGKVFKERMHASIQMDDTRDLLGSQVSDKVEVMDSWDSDRCLLSSICRFN